MSKIAVKRRFHVVEVILRMARPSDIFTGAAKRHFYRRGQATFLPARPSDIFIGAAKRHFYRRGQAMEVSYV